MIPAGKPGKFSTMQFHGIKKSKLRWAGEITRTVSGCRELTTSSKSVGHKTFEHDGVQVGASQIDRRRVACGTRPDDHLSKEAKSYKKFVCSRTQG